jgi:hypothetical protein
MLKENKDMKIYNFSSYLKEISKMINYLCPIRLTVSFLCSSLATFILAYYGRVTNQQG